jgi:hypothetical protein
MRLGRIRRRSAGHLRRESLEPPEQQQPLGAHSSSGSLRQDGRMVEGIAGREALGQTKRPERPRTGPWLCPCSYPWCEALPNASQRAREGRSPAHEGGSPPTGSGHAIAAWCRRVGRRKTPRPGAELERPTRMIASAPTQDELQPIIGAPRVGRNPTGCSTHPPSIVPRGDVQDKRAVTILFNSSCFL